MSLPCPYNPIFNHYFYVFQYSHYLWSTSPNTDNQLASVYLLIHSTSFLCVQQCSVGHNGIIFTPTRTARFMHYCFTSNFSSYCSRESISALLLYHTFADDGWETGKQKHIDPACQEFFHHMKVAMLQQLVSRPCSFLMLSFDVFLA